MCGGRTLRRTALPGSRVECVQCPRRPSEQNHVVYGYYSCASGAVSDTRIASSEVSDLLQPIASVPSSYPMRMNHIG